MKLLPKITLVTLSLFASAAFAGQLTLNVNNTTDKALYPFVFQSQNLKFNGVPDKIPAHSTAMITIKNLSTTNDAIVNGSLGFDDGTGYKINMGLGVNDPNNFNSIVKFNASTEGNYTVSVPNDTWSRENNKVINETIASNNIK